MAGFKELRIASFDPDYATLQGYRPRLIDFALTAAATLAAFEAVIAVVGYSGAAALETSGSVTMATAGGLAVAAAVVIRRLGLRARRRLQPSKAAKIARYGRFDRGRVDPQIRQSFSPLADDIVMGEEFELVAG